jgi:hypothetical protein
MLTKGAEFDRLHNAIGQSGRCRNEMRKDAEKSKWAPLLPPLTAISGAIELVD